MSNLPPLPDSALPNIVPPPVENIPQMDKPMMTMKKSGGDKPVQIKKKRKIWPIIGAILGVLILLGAGSFALFGPQIVSYVQDLRSRASACNPDTYNECCSQGYSRSVTRTCVNGQAKYDVRACNQLDGACGQPPGGGGGGAPPPPSCPDGYQYQANRGCVCVAPQGCGSTPNGKTDAEAAARPTPTTPPAGGTPGCSNQSTLYCPHTLGGFQSCPDPICATATKTCNQVAQELGCYQAGSGNNADCEFYVLYKCPNSFNMWATGCNSNGGGAVYSLPSFESPYCGTQQIDCKTTIATGGRQILVGSKEDRSSCAVAPTPTTPPATGGGETPQAPAVPTPTTPPAVPTPTGTLAPTPTMTNTPTPTMTPTGTLTPTQTPTPTPTLAPGETPRPMATPTSITELPSTGLSFTDIRGFGWRIDYDTAGNIISSLIVVV